jgi:hypothetical protein
MSQGSGGGGIVSGLISLVRYMLITAVGLTVVLLIMAATTDAAREAFSSGVLVGVGETVRQLPGLIQDIRNAA